MKLTDAFLRSIKATGKAQKHTDGGGLYLYVSASGGKLWRMDYRFEGKRKTLSMGNTPPFLSLMPVPAARKPKRNFPRALTPAPRKKPLRPPSGRNPRAAMK
jgi:hypothetical protein